MAEGNGVANGNGRRHHRDRIPEHAWSDRFGQGDRLPPQNLEAERSVLGSILLDASFFRDVRAILNVPDFYRDAHQRIYQAMLDLDEVGRPIDILTVSSQLAESREVSSEGDDDRLLEECVNAVPHAANAKYYAGLVKDKAIIRFIIEDNCLLIRNAYSGTFTADELLSQYEKKSNALAHSVAGSRTEDEETCFTSLPVGMGDAAYRGIAGKIVKIIADNTEACAESILLQLLVAFASVIGGRPHFVEGGKRHRCNQYLAVVGPTGCGKGMAWDVVEWLMRQCNPAWTAKPFLSGMTSGEGLIKKIEESGGSILAVEEELARVMGNMGRDGNSLSAVLRVAWERSVLIIPTKNNDVQVENAYVNMIAHVTPTELKRLLGPADIENGLANRFMWSTAYLARFLPRGGDFELLTTVLKPHLTKLLRAADYGLATDEMSRPFHRDREAGAFWDSIYKDLRKRPAGPYGSATMRGAPIVMRLAVLYAVLDQECEVKKTHIESALACWGYCDRTAASLFGNTAVDQDGQKVMRALKGVEGGLTRTEIGRKAFRGHKTGEALDAILGALNHSQMIRSHVVDRGGNACTLWIEA